MATIRIVDDVARALRAGISLATRIKKIRDYGLGRPPR